MSAKYTGQRKAFDFLREKFNTQDPFTKEELRTITGFPSNTFTTYWSKQFLTLLVELKGGQYRVGEVFRRFDVWPKFRNHVTQTRSLAEDYSIFTFQKVMMFEFFMPLTNESHLRRSLDALFYKDTILKRLKTVDSDELKLKFEKRGSESEAQYLNRACAWISEKFGGYSISHVNGRFRAGDLLMLGEVYERAAKGFTRYLVDETTAVVRFVFPCGSHSESKEFPPEGYCDQLLAEADNATNNEAARIRWFFSVLFVRSIVEAVNAEEEIWLLESGLESKLHIWRLQREPEEA